MVVALLGLLFAAATPSKTEWLQPRLLLRGNFRNIYGLCGKSLYAIRAATPKIGIKQTSTHPTEKRDPIGFSGTIEAVPISNLGQIGKPVELGATQIILGVCENGSLALADKRLYSYAGINGDNMPTQRFAPELRGLVVNGHYSMLLDGSKALLFNDGRISGIISGLPSGQFATALSPTNGLLLTISVSGVSDTSDTLTLTRYEIHNNATVISIARIDAPLVIKNASFMDIACFDATTLYGCLCYKEGKIFVNPEKSAWKYRIAAYLVAIDIASGRCERILRLGDVGPNNDIDSYGIEQHTFALWSKGKLLFLRNGNIYLLERIASRNVPRRMAYSTPR